MRIEASTAIFAMVLAFGLIGVVVIETVFILPQEADARGCNNSIAFNASKGRCFHG
jgi:hypothetical protein